MVQRRHANRHARLTAVNPASDGHVDSVHLRGVADVG